MIKVRIAGPTDVDELVRVINAAYRVEDFFVDGDRTNADDVRHRMSEAGGLFLVIDADTRGSLLASVHVHVRDTEGHFGLLAVDPARQGRGLGRVLMDAVEAHCRAAGCEELTLDFVNLRAELPGFYARLGFTLTGETAPMPSTERLRRPAHLVAMRKPLGR
jgi:GNAT superfamily N-acetyltransferase